MAKSFPPLGFIRKSEETLEHDVTVHSATMRTYLAPIKREGIRPEELFSFWKEHGNMLLNTIALVKVDDDDKEEIISVVEMSPVEAVAILNNQTKRNQNIKFILNPDDQEKIYGRKIPGLNNLEVSIGIDEEKGIFGDYELYNISGIGGDKCSDVIAKANDEIRVYFGAVSGKSDTLLNILALNKANNDKIDETREELLEQVEAGEMPSKFGMKKDTHEEDYDASIVHRLSLRELIEASMMGTINIIDEVPVIKDCEDLTIVHDTTFDAGGFTASLRKVAVGLKNGWLNISEKGIAVNMYGIGIDIKALTFDADKFDLDVHVFFKQRTDHDHLFDIAHVQLKLEPKQNG